MTEGGSAGVVEWREDPLGRPLYPRLRSRLVVIASGLVASGFSQSRSKPWLFVRDTPIGPVFANLGGTVVVAIWENTSALLHDQIRGARWLRRKELRVIEEKLRANEVPFRYSFYATDEPGGLLVLTDGEPEGPEGELADGFCKRCGAELFTANLYCEEHRATIEFANDEASRAPCAACGDRYRLEQTIVHHTSYSPETTVRVCRSCHQRIHRSGGFPDLKPEVSRSEHLAEEGRRKALEASQRASEKSKAAEAKAAKASQRASEKSKAAEAAAALLFTCLKCGFRGPTRYRTTCPRCRTTYPFAGSSPEVSP